MSKNELPPVEYAPDYWDGHEPADDCAITEPATQRKRLPGRRNEKKGQLFAREILVDFLTTADRTPLRAFKKGEVLLADQFAEGTIVEFKDEYLKTDFTTLAQPYFSSERLGVI